MIMTCSKDREAAVPPKRVAARPGSEESGKVVRRGSPPRIDASTKQAVPGNDPRADSLLVELAVNGSQEAFEELFMRYRERVYRIAYGWCFERETALDLVQDVFIKAFRSLDRFRRESSLWTWLCRITINRCLDFIRKKERNREIPVEAPEDVAPDGRKRIIEPPEDLELMELKGAVTRTIDDLSTEARSAFILRFYDNLSYKEIAQALDCSVGTVMSRLFYARQKLKTLLEDYL
jgi:RNA polymerase sigma-70 factor (ECF subfamily)